MTTTLMRRRLDLCELIKTAYPHEPTERTITAVMTVDDTILETKYKTWDNALYLVLGGDTKAIQNAIDEDLENDPMNILFNETF